MPAESGARAASIASQPRLSDSSAMASSFDRHRLTRCTGEIHLPIRRDSGNHVRTMAETHLVKPDRAYLPSYRAALARGWSPDNTRAAVATEHLAQIEEDAAAFLASLNDVEARGAPFRAPDGTL